MRDHPVDRPVGKAAAPVLMDLAPEVVDELPRHPRRPVEALLRSDPLPQKAMNSRKSRACSFRDRSLVVTSVGK